MKKETENWLKIANNELKVANILFKEESYLKVIEHSHAALEKLLKGIITEQNNTPPKIHNLLKLVSITLIGNTQEDLKSVLEELDDMYISVRYPEDFDAVQAKLPKEKVSQLFNETKRIYKLLEKNLL